MHNIVDDIISDCCKKTSALSNEFQKIPYPYIENDLSDEDKMRMIEHHFGKILETLGLDIEDDSLKKTPQRYAKMLVKELFEGLREDSFPKITTQENKFHYRNPVIESHISIYSICEHHFVPILGYCHIAYIPKERIIGLSKLNRIAQFYAKRPQVQERMTKQIAFALIEILQTPDVAVVIDAAHLCVRMRGIKDHDSLTRTSEMNGAFLLDNFRKEFFATIPKLSEFSL